ncbi:transglycosylase SLT domain-containing protein [Collimonas pratensis]|uniref:Transglycosylase SLT domain protein n=1 Tax=Collimonas pratensis TaxID=279113 RepID=A0A127QB64_9BURK|nr:lytic transglycosylase domain-containing protein [Collimonas pratensis]AMP07298.1 transglycosylase SLT domain protein [Collimonas pratensis]NKI71554.1 transglycosylase SLT domain-containing protein [Collimonas pratensis]
MFKKKWLAVIAVAVASSAVLTSAAYAQKRSASSASIGSYASQDDAFLALRDAARANNADKAELLASTLGDYDIPSYVDYYRLKPLIKDLVAPQADIRDYLSRYDGSAIADRLRNDWLLELGKAGDWATFDEQYPKFVLDDDTQLKCYALTSAALKGVNVAAEARALLTTPKDFGQGCTDLVGTLAQNGQFTADDVWFQIRQAVESGFAGVARRMTPFVDADDAQVAQAIDKSALLLARGPGAGRSGHELFILALGRVAKNDPGRAAGALSTSSDQLTSAERSLAWAQIALQSALKLEPQALDYWRQVRNNATLSGDAYQWRVRSALRGGDWKLVRSGIEAMPATLRSDPTWIYWLARADQAEGKVDQAQQQFQSIADQTNFYGQLALEELGQKIIAVSSTQAFSPIEMAAMTNNQGFRRALRFFDMNLRFEGVREWNWELRKMTDRQLLTAAEFARQNNVLDRMVNTSDRTKVEVDFNQRFPSPHRDVMTTNTQNLGLDMAWVYGLIRQESRFMRSARSNVGASGLMQVMPATAKWVARKIGLSGFTTDQISDVNTNILLGTNYLSMVLADLDGSQALASAAYNAGPGRPRAWRSTLPGTVEGAIFAESIPFNETRGYVKNVLSNATYYAALFDGKPQSLKARLGTVAPKGFVESALP